MPKGIPINATSATVISPPHTAPLTANSQASKHDADKDRFSKKLRTKQNGIKMRAKAHQMAINSSKPVKGVVKEVGPAYCRIL